MYCECETSVATTVGETDGMKIDVGLHQGSRLSPFLCKLVLDVITEEIDEETPWAMLFADDLVLCDEFSDRMEERLENCRGCPEDAGLKVSRAKTGHLPPLDSTIKIRMKYDEETQTELRTTSAFKYLGKTINQEGRCAKEASKRIENAWNRWRELIGVLCNKKVLDQPQGIIVQDCH